MTSKARRKLMYKIQTAIRADASITLSAKDLRMINLKATEYWYDNYQENDSPKGETIPGVNFEMQKVKVHKIEEYRMEEPSYMIDVCSECKTASCWHGEFMCDDARSAGLVKISRLDLDNLCLEHKDNYSDKKLKLMGIK